jgi:hypothetical protein
MLGMDLHGVFGDEQFPGNRAIADALGYVTQDLRFQ